VAEPGLFAELGLFADERHEHGIRVVNVRPKLGCEFVPGPQASGKADSVQRLAGVEQLKVITLSEDITHNGCGFRRVG
jgi:hypothetical protein